MNPNFLKSCLQVTSYGRIVHQPDNPQGVVIVGEHGKPVLTVTEVSDESVVNLFLESADPITEMTEPNNYEILSLR